MKYNSILMEAKLVSKTEPHNRMHLTLSDVVAAVISSGGVSDTTDI